MPGVKDGSPKAPKPSILKSKHQKTIVSGKADCDDLEKKEDPLPDQFEALLSQTSQYQPPPPPTKTVLATIPTDLWIKLFTYSAALLIVPPFVCFAGYRYFFPDNLIFSAVFSIVLANLIVASFIYAALTEDGDEKEKFE